MTDKTMRDKIAAIVHEHETIGVDHWGAADAILDEFPELTETQMDWEARIAELEAALAWYKEQVYFFANGTTVRANEAAIVLEEDGGKKAFAALKGENK